MPLRHDIAKRARVARRQRLKIRLIFSTVLLAALFGAAVYWSRQDSWLIDSVAVEGNQTVTFDQIVISVKEDLKGNYFLVFPRRNILWYPRSVITADLLSRLPSLASVEMRVEDTLLIVSVSERRGEFVWCSREDGDVCYLVDNTGLIFSSAPRFSAQPFFELVGFLPLEPIASRPLSEQDFHQLINLRQQISQIIDQVLPAGSFKIFRVSLAEAGDYHFWLSNGSKIILNAKQDIAVILANLRSVLVTPALEEAFLEAPLPVEYIDLRFAPKVFYKLR